MTPYIAGAGETLLFFLAIALSVAGFLWVVGKLFDYLYENLK